MKYLRYLLIFVPIAVAAELLGWDPLIIFSCSCIALVPLAGLLGEATEELAIHTGPKIGGLLNATLGNAAELIITIVALSAGKLDLVKASITGSILGNLLLIMGASLLLGGLKNGIQRFAFTSIRDDHCPRAGRSHAAVFSVSSSVAPLLRVTRFLRTLRLL